MICGWRGAGRFCLRRKPISLRLGEPFGHPDAPANIETERDGLPHIRLGSEDVHLEARRKCGVLRRIGWRQPGKQNDIGWWCFGSSGGDGNERQPGGERESKSEMHGDNRV